MLTLPGYTFSDTLYLGPETALYRGYRNADRLPVVAKTARGERASRYILAKLRHEHAILRDLQGVPGVLQVYALEPHGNNLALALEDPGAVPLSDVLSGQRLDLASALRIALAVATTLEGVHKRRIIHKDIKPQNILVDIAKDGRRVYLIDYGIATRLSQENQRAGDPEALEGTLAYVSPEQTGRMNRVIDYRTDFYSLGVTLYEMLTGSVPFTAKTAMEVVHQHIARAPASPRERAPGLPEPVSAITLKLLAKVAEERYQSAYGLRADLEKCLHDLGSKGSIPEFTLGAHDYSDELRIPQKLYGRGADIERLLAAFTRAGQGVPELLLLSGPSGIGKSAMVQEIHRLIARRGGYFIAGKFEQLNRSVPYAAITQAFRELLRQILTEPAESLERWKRKLHAAVGRSGGLLTDLIPELELILGPQPSPAHLDGAEAKNRFNLLMQRLLGAFCSVDTPVAVFLDDLQWADAVSLRLLEAMLTDPECRHLLVIGAYRDNEVDAAHPIWPMSEGVRQRGGVVSELNLKPLALGDVMQLVADTLGCSLRTAGPLADLITSKTHGNPFFVNQFLLSLHAEKLLSFDPEARVWRWSDAVIAERDVTDNVVDFLIANLRRLAPDKQRVLELAACIGYQFDLRTLAIIHDTTPAETAKILWRALQRGLIVPVDPEYRFLETADLGANDPIPESALGASFRFLHDRVQQAAYSLIPEAEKRQAHLRIGRLMLKNRPPSMTGSDDDFFELINHLNLGAELISDPAERLELARLNLRAARHAKTAAAFVLAAEYFRAGASLLAEGSWEQEYDLTFALKLGLAECEYLNGRPEIADELFHGILGKARSNQDRAEVHNKLLLVYNNASKFAEAIACGLNGLALFGVSFPEAPQDRMALFKARLGEVSAELGARSRDELLNYRLMSDPDQIAVSRLLDDIIIPVYISAPALYPLIAVTQIQHSLQHGYTAATPQYFATYGFLLTLILGQHRVGCQMGELAVALQGRFQNPAIGAKVDMNFGSYCHYGRPMAEAVYYMERMHQPAMEAGDLHSLSYSCAMGSMMRLGMGDDLESVFERLGRYSILVRRTKNELAADQLLYCRQVVANLTSRLKSRASIDDDTFSEEAFFKRQEQSRSAIANAYGCLLKLQLLFLYEDYAQAAQVARRAEQLLPAARVLYYTLEFSFYYPMTLLALSSSATPAEQEEYNAIIDTHHAKLRALAEQCPENFQRKATLLEAERARVAGKDVEASILYEQAIQQAKESKATHDEAIANEACAKHHLRRGRHMLAGAYMTEAYALFLQWGASAKCADMAEKHASLLWRSTAPAVATTAEERAMSVTTTRMIQQGLIDVETVLRAAQEISSAITLDKVLPEVVRIAVGHAGAQRGYLFLEREGSLHLAEATPMTPTRAGAQAASAPEAPMSVVQYVARTRELFVSPDAAREPRFLHDPHLAARPAKSVLCLPLMRQSRVIGVLYLEHAAPDTFTPYKVELLRLLTSQAGIAIENALLYSQVHNATSALRASNEQLEQEVAQRTEQLREANERLLGRTEELREANERLVRELSERERAEEARAALQEEIIRMQRATLEEVSTPLIPINDRTVVMPLIGSMDRERAQQIVGTALQGAQRHRAQAVIIDITGMKHIDSDVAGTFINAAAALRLLGTHTILTGIRPEVAQTLVSMGIDLSKLVTRSTLQSGIAHALSLTNRS